VVVEVGVETVPGVAPKFNAPGLGLKRVGELIAAGIDRIEIHSRGAASREQGDIMLKARRDAALKVAESLFAAEDAIDAALARAAELNAAIVTARTDANLSAMVGHDAFEMAASAFAALARARCDIIESHKRLDEAKTQIGLRVMSVGELGKPPVEGHQKSTHLQAVA
jgi:hypothetical protein